MASLSDCRNGPSSQSSPSHRSASVISCILGRARAVGVFYPEYEFTAAVPGEEPVEDGCPRPAYMEGARGARGESGPDCHGGKMLI